MGVNPSGVPEASNACIVDPSFKNVVESNDKHIDETKIKAWFAAQCEGKSECGAKF